MMAGVSGKVEIRISVSRPALTRLAAVIGTCTSISSLSPIGTISMSLLFGVISTPGAWPRVGTDHYPWYPQMRVFLPPGFRQWAPVMGEVAEALGEFTAS